MSYNRIIEAYASAARTASPTDVAVKRTSGDITFVGAIITIDVTAVAATPSVVFNVLGVDQKTGATWTILSSAAITGTGTTVLMIGEGIADETNLSANSLLPSEFRIDPVHADGDSITYSVSVEIVN